MVLFVVKRLGPSPTRHTAPAHPGNAPVFWRSWECTNLMEVRRTEQSRRSRKTKTATSPCSWDKARRGYYTGDVSCIKHTSLVKLGCAQHAAILIGILQYVCSHLTSPIIDISAKLAFNLFRTDGEKRTHFHSLKNEAFHTHSLS